MVGTVVMWFEA